MKCSICEKEAMSGSIVCSENCNEIRLMIIKLSNKHTPTNGCENCWGDLGQGCTDKCKNESKLSYEFIKKMYSLVRLALKAGALIVAEIDRPNSENA